MSKINRVKANAFESQNLKDCMHLSCKTVPIQKVPACNG